MLVTVTLGLILSPTLVSSVPSKPSGGSAGCGKAPPYNGTVKLSVQRPEGEREFYVHVPAGFTNNETIPLIIAFHGWLVDTCEYIATCKEGDCGLTDFSDSQGFVLIRACGYQRSWNAGECCSPANVLNLDDGAFAQAMISLMQEQFCIDSTKIFSIGFSNGAMLSEVFMCSMWNVFSAAVSVSGVIEIIPGGSQGEEKCNATYMNGPRDMSVLNVHGTLDPIVPWDGDFLLGYPAIPYAFNQWALRNECHGSPKQTFSTGAYSNQVYQNCTGTSQIELVKVQGGGHWWPRDSNFDTTAYLLQFLQRVSGWKPWSSNALAVYEQ